MPSNSYRTCRLHYTFLLSATNVARASSRPDSIEKSKPIEIVPLLSLNARNGSLRDTTGCTESQLEGKLGGGANGEFVSEEALVRWYQFLKCSSSRSPRREKGRKTPRNTRLCPICYPGAHSTSPRARQLVAGHYRRLEAATR